MGLTILWSHNIVFPIINQKNKFYSSSDSLQPDGIMPTISLTLKTHIGSFSIFNGYIKKTLRNFQRSRYNTLIPIGKNFLQGGARVGLQLFEWKIIQQLINNNTRINSVLHTHNYKPTFAPHCMKQIYS